MLRALLLHLVTLHTGLCTAMPVNFVVQPQGRCNGSGVCQVISVPASCTSLSARPPQPTPTTGYLWCSLQVDTGMSDREYACRTLTQVCSAAH